MAITVHRNDFTITTDRHKLDLEIIHRFLANDSYWSRNIPFETVKKAVENSLNFGVFYKDKQVGFARVITDFTTIAYLGDVFILPEYRGQGLSKWLIQEIVAHPDLQGLRRWVLLTVDAHELYKKYGWKPVSNPERYMERHDPDIYAHSP